MQTQTSLLKLKTRHFHYRRLQINGKVSRKFSIKQYYVTVNLIQIIDIKFFKTLIYGGSFILFILIKKIYRIVIVIEKYYFTRTLYSDWASVS